jgi:hypothetical protein
MTPEISEFSYGFALINELIGWLPLHAAPIFPSLIAEGQPDGGYDVALDAPGIPMFLQFKRAECMVRNSARETAKFGAGLSLPYYRFDVTRTGKSNQHAMLLGLANNKNFVAYAAPRFHDLEGINNAWEKGEVVARSVFVRPKAIGKLDGRRHTVAYDGSKAFLCSEPIEISAIRGGNILERLQKMLNREKRPLREAIHDWQEEVERAVRNSGKSDDLIGKDDDIDSELIASTPLLRRVSEDEVPLVRVPIRDPKQLTGEEKVLSETAKSALERLHTQMVVVQAA